MTKYDILTLKAAVLYVLSKNEKNSLDRMHLSKILYFANQKHLTKYGRNVIEDTFYSLPNGPVPTILYDLIKSKSINAKGFDSDNKYNTLLNAISTKGNDVTALENYDELDLSDTDKECLDESFKENVSLPFKELSDKSHDSAYKANKNKTRAMSDLKIAEAGGASNGMIEYIEDYYALKAALL